MSYIAIVKKAPQKAGTLKTRLLRNPINNGAVFSDKVPIELWPKLVLIIKMIETELVKVIPEINTNFSRLLGTWRGAVALCAIAKITETFKFNTQSIMNIDASFINSGFVKDIFYSLIELYQNKARVDLNNNYYIKRYNYIDVVCRLFGAKENINDSDIIGIWNFPSEIKQYPHAYYLQESEISQSTQISEEILNLVFNELPEQPWPKGMLKAISTKLQLHRKIIFMASSVRLRKGQRPEGVAGFDS